MVKRFLLAAAVTVVAGCGAEAKDPDKPARDKDRQAMLDYAACMRENDIDMPDPKFEGGRVIMRAGGAPGETDPDMLRKAEAACAKYREAVAPPEVSDEEKEEFKQAALEHSRCMRKNGIENFPDPKFDEDGGAQVALGPNLSPENPAFKRAQKACEETMPGNGDEG